MLYAYIRCDMWALLLLLSYRRQDFLFSNKHIRGIYVCSIEPIVLHAQWRDLSAKLSPSAISNISKFYRLLFCHWKGSRGATSVIQFQLRCTLHCKRPDVLRFFFFVVGRLFSVTHFGLLFLQQNRLRHRWFPCSLWNANDNNFFSVFAHDTWAMNSTDQQATRSICVNAPCHRIRNETQLELFGKLFRLINVQASGFTNGMTYDIWHLLFIDF